LVENQATLDRMPHAGGRFVFWVLGLITIGVAVEALNLPWLDRGVGRVVAYVPHVIAAAFILAAGYFGGNFIYRQIAAGEGTQALLGRLVRGAIFLFAGFMALHELGIATAIVTTAFVIVLGALAVAGALSFGLGTRELAGRISRDWYEQRRPTYRRYDPTTTRTREQDEIEGQERRNPTH
jgi:quinol-cytochrome oxidoreductase complex cytochrome b subunit